MNRGGEPAKIALGLLKLTVPSSESGDAWEGFLTGLGERGLRCPLLVISDGGRVDRRARADHGCRAAATLPGASRPKRAGQGAQERPGAGEGRLLGDLRRARHDRAGLDAVGYVQKRIDSFDKRWRDAYPAAVRCLLDDRDSLTVYLRFPRAHWTRVRHSNFIVIWSSPGSVFDVRHAALRCLVVRGGRGYLQSSSRQSLRRDDASGTSHLTGLVA